MNEKQQFDFWYAAQNTRIVVWPKRRLETFGTTLLNYHMISELMDTAGKVRVREGRILAYRPKVITPTSFTKTALEGFGDEAERYVDWLRQHSKDLRILQYGFAIRKELTDENILSDNLEAVVERVELAVKAKDDPLAAVVVGVDDPWEVCVIKLMVDVSGHSFPGNVRDLERRDLFAEQDGIPRAVRDEIESDFVSASQDSSKVKDLGHKLQRLGVFEVYEDRFFSLVNASKRP